MTLGLFVPRFGRLCLIGSGLTILGRTASAGLGRLVLFRGWPLLDRLFLLLGRLVTGGGEIHHLPARRHHRAAGPGDKGIADRLLPAAGPAARGFSADSESFGIQTVIDGLHVVPSCIGFPVDKPILLHALSHRPDRAGPGPRSVCIDGLGRKKDPMG